MNLKCLLVPILLSTSFSLLAQDKIYKKDGSIVEAKVKSVGTSKISYVRFDNPDGPEYSFSINDITKIVYQNGTTDNFEKPKADHKKEHHQAKYGNNIFSLIPGAYTAALNGTINDPGIGISYERLLDEDGHFGFTLPLLYSFTQNKDFNNNYYYYSSSYTYTGPNNYSSLTLMPGVKFYPAKGKNNVRYSLGILFFATFGSEPYDVYDNSYNSSPVTPGTRGDWKYTMYGVMVSNALNISVTKHFYMELDVNGGVPFSDNRRADASSIDNVFSPTIQFVLKAGARF